MMVNESWEAMRVAVGDLRKASLGGYLEVCSDKHAIRNIKYLRQR